MPRPPLKKRKPNNRRPAHFENIPPDAGLTRSPRLKLQQDLANKLIGQRPQDSDDSDRLVTRRRSGRTRNNADGQIYASGGVAKGDKPGEFPTKQERQRRLRSETNEIVRRSRSKSVEGVNRAASKSSGDRILDNESSAPSPTTKHHAHAIRSPQSVLPKALGTPSGEMSVLGTLKPRRRQPSILHMIDNNDSSTINPEDEEHFLPDDESTPLNTKGMTQAVNSVSPSQTIPNSTSRKRKLGMDQPIVNALSNTGSSPAALSIRSNDDRLPVLARPLKLHPVAADDDVMAPPESSSPESSPQRTKPPAPSGSKKLHPVPTTAQLQSLMPAKRRKGTRERRQVADFDIPEDSYSDPVEQEHSAFLPRKGTKSSKPKKGAVTQSSQSTKPRKQGRGKAGPSRGVNNVQTPKSKSTSTAPAPVPTSILPVTPRTPLPLTRKTIQENQPLALAPSSKQNGDKGRRQDTADGKQQQRGGSLRSSSRRTRNDLLRTGAESDKENRGRVGRTRLSRKQASAITSEEEREASEDIAHPSIEEQENEVDEAEVLMESEIEPQVARGISIDVDNSNKTKLVKTGATPLGIEAKVWKNKWAGIDDWSLDYEEVSISTSSSSPGRR